MHRKLLKVLHSKVHWRCAPTRAQSLTLSEGAQLIADGAKGLIFGQGGVICDPPLHVHHHLLLLIRTRDTLWWAKPKQTQTCGESSVLPARRQAPYNSTLTPNMCAQQMTAGPLECKHKHVLDVWRTCGQKVEPKPDRRSDLQVCLISWVLFVTSGCEADVFQTFCSRTSFSTIFLRKSRNAVKKLQSGINQT